MGVQSHRIEDVRPEDAVVLGVVLPRRPVPGAERRIVVTPFRAAFVLQRWSATSWRSVCILLDNIRHLTILRFSCLVLFINNEVISPDFNFLNNLYAIFGLGINYFNYKCIKEFHILPSIYKKWQKMNKPIIITNIITDEIKKMLNEGTVLSDDKLRFQQRLNNSTFNNYESFTNEFDSRVSESDIIATWKVLFWINQFGIENFIIDVEKIEGTFMLQMYDKHSDKMEQETPKNINDFDWKFVIDNASLVRGGSLYLSALSFDFKTNTCTSNT